MPSQKPTLREVALQTDKTNPSQLGDPISLKAETSSTSPTPEDRGANSPSSSSSRVSSVKGHLQHTAPAPTEGDDDRKGESEQDKTGGRPTLRQKAMQKLDENPSQLGDPVSLKAETADSKPTDQDRGAGSQGGRSKL